MQVFYLFNSRFIRQSSWHLDRFFTNNVVWFAVLALVIFQLTFVYAPFMQTAFGSAPLELRHWLVPVGVGLAIFFIVEVEKAITQVAKRTGAVVERRREPVDQSG